MTLKLYFFYLKLCKFVMTPDMGIVGRQGHEEVDQGEDHQEAGDGGNDEHHLEHDQVTKAAYYQPWESGPRKQEMVAMMNIT